MTQPFHFSNGQLAYSVEDLVRICEQSQSECIHYLMREDLEKWLDYIGKTDLANSARQAREAALSDEERLQQFLSSCKPQPAQPAPVSQTPDGDGSKPSQEYQPPKEEAKNPIMAGLKAISRWFGG
jgi:hypothetical protein